MLYESDKKPIIELNGFEHYSNEITINRDKQKYFAKRRVLGLLPLKMRMRKITLLCVT